MSGGEPQSQFTGDTSEVPSPFSGTYPVGCNFASWNQINAWLRQVETPGRAA